MKKTIGIIIMVVDALFFCILILAEVLLFKNGKAPTSIAEWIGNLIIPALSVALFFVGNSLRKK